VRLVRVAEVEGKAGPVDGALRGAVGDFEQPVALDHALRAHADVLAEQALQGARAHAELLQHLLDARDAAVRGDPRGNATGQQHAVVDREPGLAQET
jgi:hypothetical protein